MLLEHIPCGRRNGGGTIHDDERYFHGDEVCIRQHFQNQQSGSIRQVSEWHSRIDTSEDPSRHGIFRGEGIISALTLTLTPLLTEYQHITAKSEGVRVKKEKKFFLFVGFLSLTHRPIGYIALLHIEVDTDFYYRQTGEKETLGIFFQVNLPHGCSSLQVFSYAVLISVINLSLASIAGLSIPQSLSCSANL